MNILALDTSMGACGAAVLTGEGIVIAREQRMARGHAEALMPMIAEAMAEAGLDYRQLDLIAATLGPGSFTGVRIAIAAARGLALVTGAKLWGTDSLTVMARTALNDGAIDMHGTPFAVAADARAGALYLGLYDAAARKREGPLLVETGAAVALLPQDLAIAVGNGAEALAAAARDSGREVDAKLIDLEPSAVALAHLAQDAGDSVPTLRPLYLRPPDAKAQRAAAVARC
jgi:tRNA threonylcarbamoyl adenosine modification protein YeaZ